MTPYAFYVQKLHVTLYSTRAEFARGGVQILRIFLMHLPAHPSRNALQNLVFPVRTLCHPRQRCAWGPPNPGGGMSTPASIMASATSLNEPPENSATRHH
jgi:hypothetical protein